VKPDPIMIASAQPQKDAKLNFFYSRIMEKLGGEDAQVDFANEITRRMNVDNVFARLAS